MGQNQNIIIKQKMKCLSQDGLISIIIIIIIIFD